MFWNMPRRSYREGQVQMSVYLSKAQHGWVKAWLSEWELDSLSDVVAELVRREVDRAESGDRPRGGVPVEADVRRSGVVAGDSGWVSAGVGAADPLEPDFDAIFGRRDTVSQPEPDPWEQIA